MPVRPAPSLKPLTARSVVLSTLLGYHPPALAVSSLVRVGALFGIAERTTRVAITRMVADGDLIAEPGAYRLADRLVRRQVQQEERCLPRTRPWDGRWEMAIVTSTSRPLAERVALRKAMDAMRLAELREGVWLRPANLEREMTSVVADQCTFFESHPREASSDLARSLWDLPALATEALRLLDELDRSADLLSGFMVTTGVLRHLQIDPALPVEMLPADWPGARLRHRYETFSTSYAGLLRDYSERREP